MLRCIKFILTLVFSVLMLPVMGLLAMGTWLSVGRPILFKQPRIGLNGRIITIYKFRSMLNARNTEGQLLPDEQRTTRFGQFIRQTSLDELPQLWNILRGDLVWVGPRPLMVDFKQALDDQHHKRHSVKPGITGWAQINGRNSISYDQKFLLDLWYVENKSLRLDLLILFKTIPIVLSGRDVAYSELSNYQQFLSSETKSNRTD